MTVGTKEYYVESFKHVLMSNSVASESTSLDSIFKGYEEDIGNSTNLNEQDKAIYTRNLEKALKQIKAEIFGKTEE